MNTNTYAPQDNDDIFEARREADREERELHRAKMTLVALTIAQQLAGPALCVAGNLGHARTAVAGCSSPAAKFLGAGPRYEDLEEVDVLAEVGRAMYGLVTNLKGSSIAAQLDEAWAEAVTPKRYRGRDDLLDRLEGAYTALETALEITPLDKLQREMKRLRERTLRSEF